MSDTPTDNASKSTKSSAKLPLQPYQERLISEKAELLVKLDKLVEFIGSDERVKLPSEDQDLLYRQENVMRAYIQVLANRIARFSN